MGCHIGVIRGGQINYGSATGLGNETWIANQLDQPEESCRGNTELFFLDETNLMSIFSLLERDTSRDPGSQMFIPVPIYSFI